MGTLAWPVLLVSAAAASSLVNAAAANIAQRNFRVDRGHTMGTILAEIGIGVLVMLAGNMPFNVLRALNLEVGSAVPWAIVPAALYLWAYWRFIGGRWGSAGSAASRRQNLRANKLSARLWAASLAAGLIGFASLIALLVLAARLVH